MAPSYTTSTEAPAEQTALKPKPVSRKVLASAGAAAFVLGNRSRVEILDLRDARMIVSTAQACSPSRPRPARRRPASAVPRPGSSY